MTDYKNLLLAWRPDLKDGAKDSPLKSQDFNP